MGTIELHPLDLRFVSLVIEAQDMGMTTIEKYLPIGVVPPVGSVELGNDGRVILWKVPWRVTKPLAYELRNKFQGRNELAEGTCQIITNRFSAPETYRQDRSISGRRVLRLSEQLDGIPNDLCINWSLIKLHHSITAIQEATAGAYANKTPVATFGSAITLNNTLVTHASYFYEFPGSFTSMGVANSAGPYTQEILVEGLTGTTHYGMMGWRLATSSEGLAQTYTVITNSNEETSLYCAEYSGIRLVSPVIGSMSTPDDGTNLAPGTGR